VTAALLSPLRRLKGVIGSFACGRQGELLASDMPLAYTPDTLVGIAARIGTLLQTAREALPSCRTVSLAFAEHRLHARRHRSGVLCVLAFADAEQRQLEIWVRLVSLRLSAGAPPSARAAASPAVV
jgi:hypothetical protein